MPYVHKVGYDPEGEDVRSPAGFCGAVYRVRGLRRRIGKVSPARSSRRWVDMRKGVAYLFRYREVSLAANAGNLQAQLTSTIPPMPSLLWIASQPANLFYHPAGSKTWGSTSLKKSA